jgi:hypothetical protein
MCQGEPESASAAISAALVAIGRVADSDLALAPIADQAECLRQLERVESVLTAARASVLSAFDRRHGFTKDGQGTARAWLMWQTQVTAGAASGAVGWMRRLRDHAGVARALRAARVSASWAKQICAWTDRLPEWARAEADEILLEAVAAGLGLEDLAWLFEQMLRKLARPDEDRAFDDRQVCIGTTFGGAGRIEGDLTPQCAEAVQAVLDALSKKMGPEDTRTRGQRRHDALYEAFRRLVAAGNLPDRAGQPVRLQLHISLEELMRRLDGREPGEQHSKDEPVASKSGSGRSTVSWRKFGDGSRRSWRLRDDDSAMPEPRPGWPLAGPGDECDASIMPVVVGAIDQELLDNLVKLLTGPLADAPDCSGGTPQAAPNSDRVRDLIVANAAALFSGPRGLASFLRRRELAGAAASASLPLDAGASTDTIPPHLRRAVILRDRHCAAPGCDQPVAACQVHHIQPRRMGGATKLTNLLLLCSFHHLILVHTWGWEITLNSDGTTTMRNPDGTKVFHSQGPPGPG